MDRRTNPLIATIDFETYSAAGFHFARGKWVVRGGIKRAGAASYAMHPTTEVLSLAYRLPAWREPSLWVPPMDPPILLFNHIAAGGLIESWNIFFEYCIWLCATDWPPLPIDQCIDAQAAARAFGLPGSLDSAGEKLGIPNLKIKDGKRLIRKFSIPRQPTKYNPNLRIRPEHDPDDMAKMYLYNMGDVKAENDISRRIPPLSPFEQKVFQAHMAINARGVSVDIKGLNRCIDVINHATEEKHKELSQLTAGQVSTAAELEKLKVWAATQGYELPNLQASTITNALNDPGLPDTVRLALEIRQITSLSSVKKLFAIRDMLGPDGRLRGLFIYCKAKRTGRWAGAGPQPQNIPSGGPDCFFCYHCGRHTPGPVCYFCNSTNTAHTKWNALAALDALENPAIYANPYAAVSGCLRALYVSAPGCDLIASDYSSIEAVVLAVLAGEQWRIDAFNRRKDIYVLSAAQLGSDSRKLGKLAELASGYQGSVGAWRQFGATGSDEEILQHVRAWRRNNPNIVRMWYAIEDCFRNALRQPGAPQAYAGVSYCYNGNHTACRLPSGRLLYYHSPADINGTLVFDEGEETYGGKLVENIIQATARDILANALVNCESAGYPVVLHVHDEIICELPEGRGSVVELEHIMGRLPQWASDWPIRAAGGYRAKRYRK